MMLSELKRPIVVTLALWAMAGAAFAAGLLEVYMPLVYAGVLVLVFGLLSLLKG